MPYMLRSLRCYSLHFIHHNEFLRVSEVVGSGDFNVKAGSGGLSLSAVLLRVACDVFRF